MGNHFGEAWWREFCGNLGYIGDYLITPGSTGPYETGFINRQVPSIYGGSTGDNMRITGHMGGYSVGETNNGLANDDNNYYIPGKEYEVTVKSDIKGGVARQLYASAGEIIASTSTGSSGGKDGKCFNANLITTDNVVFTWKAPPSGTGEVWMRAIVGSDKNTTLVRFPDDCDDHAITPSKDFVENNNPGTNRKICYANSPSNYTSSAPFVFIGSRLSFINEGFVPNPEGITGGKLSLFPSKLQMYL